MYANIIYTTATFLYTDGVEENVPQCAVSQKGLDSVVPPPTSVHGCLKTTATEFPTAVGSAEGPTCTCVLRFI